MSLDKLGPKTKADGNLQETPVEDVDAIGILTSILRELKILNLHMTVMTDNQFTKQDVE